MGSDELIVFTHNDLDALGCMLNLEFKWPTVRKKYFHTNYANISQIVDEIEEYITRTGNKHIVIPDVSFATDKKALTRLYNTGAHVTHIDHHLYPDGFWDDYPDMKVVWDKSKSATLLCNEYLGNKGQNANLDRISELIDVYDLWQVKSPLFDVSQDINEYFWKFDIAWLADQMFTNNFKLPNNFKPVVTKIKEDYTKALESYEKRNLIHRAEDITVAFVNEWFNQILIEEMKKGQNVVINVMTYGIIKVRINQDAPYTSERLNELRFKLTGSKDIGHMHAFTYKMEAQTSFDNIMKEIEHVIKTIGETLQ